MHTSMQPKAPDATASLDSKLIPDLNKMMCFGGVEARGSRGYIGVPRYSEK
jgi:hypothetical protein